MTETEKQSLCETLASLFSPPDAEGLEQVREAGPLLERWLRAEGGAAALLSSLQTAPGEEAYCRELGEEYDRLFGGKDGEFVSLVESSHKPWTADPECHLSFAREEGLLMGDSALHLAQIFEQAGLEVTLPFQSCPDHLALELEFLSLLYGEATDLEVRQFIQDHLDWVPLLKSRIIALRPHPFYLGAAELLDRFLSCEKNRLEIRDDGEKNLH